MSFTSNSVYGIPLYSVYVYIVVVFKFQEGGPIIAVQVENEYGSYAKDDKYMAFIKNVSFFYF